MLNQAHDRDSSATRLEECPFCGANLTEFTPARHLEQCRDFYQAFDKEPPDTVIQSESTASTQDPTPEPNEKLRAAVNEAAADGKWVGRAPAGFDVVNGYLQVDTEEFTAIADGLARVAAGESLWSVSRDVDPIHNSTFRRIHSDPNRRTIYTDLRANDQRIRAALEEWSGDCTGE